MAGKTVLMADDEPHIRYMLQYKVSVANIGELEQLTAAIEEVPGVISVERILARSSKS